MYQTTGVGQTALRLPQEASNQADKDLTEAQHDLSALEAEMEMKRHAGSSDGGDGSSSASSLQGMIDLLSRVLEDMQSTPGTEQNV